MHPDESRRIAACCISAMLAEVSASPKPGLVDRLNSGSHGDMDFFTFLHSTAAIAPYFSEFAQLGAALTVPGPESLALLRPLGVACEHAMFWATQGVNTHKGAIFSLALIAASAGFCRQNSRPLTAEQICAVSAAIAAGAIQDFSKPELQNTKGQELYHTQGVRGIRGEAASGFASVTTHALGVLRSGFADGCCENDIYLQALLQLTANVEDTNVLARGGPQALAYLHQASRQALALGGAFTPQGREKLHEMNESFIERRISPGGCADLLAVAIALYRIETCGE